MEKIIRQIGHKMVLAILFSTFLLLSGWGQEEPTPPPRPPSLPAQYLLTPHLSSGNKFIIDEEQKWEGAITIKTDRDQQKFPCATSICHNYREEIIKSNNLIESKRQYLMSRKKSYLPGEETKSEITFLEGKTIFLEQKDGQVKIIDELTPKESMVPEGDLIYLSPLGQFFPLLPTQQVRVNNKWEIKAPELARIAFRNYYQAEGCSIEGTGVLEEIITAQDTQIAKISVTLKSSTEMTKERPSLNADLIGTILFDLKQKYISSVELSGPFILYQKIDATKEESIEVVSTGTITLKSKCKMVKD